MSPAQPSVPPPPEGPESRNLDFGWRLHGRTVGVLEDRSFDLRDAERPAGSFLGGYCRDVTSLQTCLQCGACTASCNLAEEGSLFPRPEMTLVQMGLAERLLADPNVWHCYNCGDCSRRCPGSAKPGRIMAAVRHMATERFAFPSFLARIVNRPRWFWLVLLVPALLLVGAVAVGGSFRPSLAPVRYATLLPHVTLSVLFFSCTALAFAAMTVGLVRAWRAWRGESRWPSRPWLFVRALLGAAGEILAHRRFGDCEQRKGKRWGHLGLFYGFLGLLVLTSIVVVLLLAGAPYPLPFGHPLKIAGNVFAFLLVAGGLVALVERWVETREGDLSTSFDWLFLFDVLGVGLTGILAEVFRLVGLPWAAYPVYVLHLVLVFPLLVLLPYTKFAHVAYRTLAVAIRRYQVLCRRYERRAVVDEQLPFPPGRGRRAGEVA